MKNGVEDFFMLFNHNGQDITIYNTNDNIEENGQAISGGRQRGRWSFAQPGTDFCGNAASKYPADRLLHDRSDRNRHRVRRVYRPLRRLSCEKIVKKVYITKFFLHFLSIKFCKI